MGTTEGADDATAVAPGTANAAKEARATDDDTSPSLRSIDPPFSQS